MATREDLDRSYACCLPQELLVNIFERLSISDIKICRSVCRSWAWSASIKLSERSCLNFKRYETDTSSTEFLTALSIATFKSLKLRNVSISFTNDCISAKWIWGPVVAALNCLTLEKCCLTERDFIRILSHSILKEDNRSKSGTINTEQIDNQVKIHDNYKHTLDDEKLTSSLKSLALVDARELFMSGTLMSQPNDMKIGSLALANVLKLDLSRNKYLNDVLFQRLTTCMPNVETLLLNDTNIQHHPGIYKKFYPEHVTENSNEEDLAGDDDLMDVKDYASDRRVKLKTNSIFNSSSIFTFGCFLQFLKNNSNKIKGLGLTRSNLSDSLISKISHIPDLCLNSFDITDNLLIKSGGMKQLAECQGRHIKDLNLSLCRRITMDYNPNLLESFESFSGLTKLVLHGISCTRGFDECLSYLKNLEHLDLTNCDIPARHLADGIVRPLEEASLLANSISTIPEVVASMKEAAKDCCARKLQVLVLSRYCRAPAQIERILRWTSNLKYLNFNGCTLSQEAMLQLFRTLKSRSLKVLNVNHCQEVGDLGYKLQLPQNNSSDLNVKDLKMPEEVTYKVIQERLNGNVNIGLRSTDSNIGDLKSLTTLRISGNLVSDSTIIESFHFYDLKTIDVSECQNITSAGFIALAYQNNHIENLTAKSCSGLDDIGLISIACCLKRLVHLDIESSHHVTSTALTITSGCDKFVGLQPNGWWHPNPNGLAGCKFLRYLNVSRCPEIHTVAIDILLDKLGSALKVQIEEEFNFPNMYYFDKYH